MFSLLNPYWLVVAIYALSFPPIAQAANRASGTANEAPRLVVQITVDQLRGDVIPRSRGKFGNGGFRRLLDRGIYYSNAHYQTGNTFTASGHAVLVTGADTAEHGMVANEWFDRDAGKISYCTGDTRYPTLGEPQKLAGGMSPAKLTSTTVGDELIIASARRSRAFAVAGKDRSAIIPAGHLGKAFWFSDSTGRFVSSTYYYDSLPAWASAWNDANHHDRYRVIEWTPMDRSAAQTSTPETDNPYARANATLGRNFPHSLTADSDALFLGALRATPFLDELTGEFARELLLGEKLGRGQATDYLSISFSATDYIGHIYGPNSAEAQDNLLRLDATLAHLLDFIDMTIGLNRTIVILSSDHGVDDIPEERQALGYTAGRIYPDKLQTLANTALRQRVGVDDDLVAAFVPPGFYLDRSRIAAHHLDQALVETALADYLRTVPGVAYAFTRSDLLAGQIAQSPLMNRVQRSFHPTRSGDVVIVQSQFWYMYPDADAYAAMHGSPYTYDTFVPIMMSGAGIRAATNYDVVSPSQIAPTLSALLRIKPPSGCVCAAPLPGSLPSDEP